MARRQASTFLPSPLKVSWPDYSHTSPPWLGSERDGSQGLGFQELPCSDLTPGCCAPLCVQRLSARYLLRVRRCSSAASPGSHSPIPVPPVPGEPRPGARRSLLGAGRGSAVGANPPARHPARRLAGRPSKTVRHGFPVGSPLRRTNPGSLNLHGKSLPGRRAGEREGATAGLRCWARRPELLPRSHSFG